MAYKLSGGFHHRCSVPAPALFSLEALFRVKTDYVCDELMVYLFYTQGLPPRGSVVKNLPANAGDVVSIPGLGRSHGGGNGNLL